jgi:dihydrofolate reductase
LEAIARRSGFGGFGGAHSFGCHQPAPGSSRSKRAGKKPAAARVHGRRDFPWSNTHHVRGDLSRTVKALKQATPRGLLVGSPQLSAALQRLDLVDEYRFVVHPVVAGHGPFLFSGPQPSLHLKFVAATQLKSGIVALHYRRS